VARKSLWSGRKRKPCFYEGDSDRKGVRGQVGYLGHVRPWCMLFECKLQLSDVLESVAYAREYACGQAVKLVSIPVSQDEKFQAQILGGLANKKWPRASRPWEPSARLAP
jgi:hypothetical protein